MLYIAENLKALRKSRDLTQEEASEILGVSPQSVSKWERGETLPDITLLPALANLYKVSVDALIGMDRINAVQTRNALFATGYKHLRACNYADAIQLFSGALKTFPNDEDIMSYLAMSLALDGDPAGFAQAVALCERILSRDQGEKVHHTTRAALCFIYFMAGEKDRAIATARKLPHVRESREMILARLEKEPTAEDISTYLKFIAIGESDEQDVIEIDFGIDMVPVCTEHDLMGRIKTMRDKINDPEHREDLRRLPQIRIRDKTNLAPRHVRVRHYADYLLDKEYASCGDAADEIMSVLEDLAAVQIAP